MVSLLPLPSSARGLLGDNSYDAQFKEASRKYGRDLDDWKQLKAQAYQESTLDPSLCSGVGACGLMQFMPATWADMEGQLGFQASPHDAGWAIQAGAYYMAQQRRFFRDVSFPDRQFLGQAGYNAGAGWIIRARKLCGQSDQWIIVQKCLPALTGKANAKQTTDYVKRIDVWYRQLLQEP